MAVVLTGVGPERRGERRQHSGLSWITYMSSRRPPTSTRTVVVARRFSNPRASLPSYARAHTGEPARAAVLPGGDLCRAPPGGTEQRACSGARRPGFVHSQETHALSAGSRRTLVGCCRCPSPADVKAALGAPDLRARLRGARMALPRESTCAACQRPECFRQFPLDRFLASARVFAAVVSRRGREARTFRHEGL
jgi:hypothetical protein